MNDALEILEEVNSLVYSLKDYTSDFIVEAVNNYVVNKRTEFEPAHGDCCG